MDPGQETRASHVKSEQYAVGRRNEWGFEIRWAEPEGSRGEECDNLNLIMAGPGLVQVGPRCSRAGDKSLAGLVKLQGNPQSSIRTPTIVFWIIGSYS